MCYSAVWKNMGKINDFIGYFLEVLGKVEASSISNLARDFCPLCVH